MAKLSDLINGALLASFAFLLIWALNSGLSPTSVASFFSSQRITTCDINNHQSKNSISTNFYNDPSLSYTVDRSISGWDDKRRRWLLHHPFPIVKRERVLLVTGSQPKPCKNPVGDHLLLRFFKNKVDYCRIHGIEIFYNNVLLHPRMFAFWAKIPVIRAAMVAHPEADWIWWVDSDAAFTDMEFELPLDRYKNHNLVVHGWPSLVYDKKSWVSLNAGVFLIRNCQWSLDFMDVWAQMGPQSPAYEEWGRTLTSEFKDKVFKDSDDQSALVYYSTKSPFTEYNIYLLLKQKGKWADKVYFEYQYYFEGYWLEIVGRLENMTNWYLEIERRTVELRRRHAERSSEEYGRIREARMASEERWTSGLKGWRRPFITHFTGCQPCSGNHSQIYSGENCWHGMERALTFADDQVLRVYGFRHPGLLNSSEVYSLLFDFPADDGEIETNEENDKR